MKDKQQNTTPRHAGQNWFSQLMFQTLYDKPREELSNLFYDADDSIVNWVKTTHRSVYECPLFAYYTCITSTLYHTGKCPPEWEKLFPAVINNISLN